MYKIGRCLPGYDGDCYYHQFDCIYGDGKREMGVILYMKIWVGGDRDVSEFSKFYHFLLQAYHYGEFKKCLRNSKERNFIWFSCPW